MASMKQQVKTRNKSTARPQFRPTTSKNFGCPKKPISRPASAREIFESCNQKKNEEAWKMEEKLSISNDMKKREWEAKFYTNLAFKKRDSTIVDWKEEKEKESKLNERREKLRKLFAEENKMYEEERGAKLKRSKTSTKDLTDPEIELLRRRLQELKRQNEEERKKLAEKLSYEAWRQNNSEFRQAQSERLSRFIQDTWDDQIKWREKEREAKEEERRKYELEMKEKRRMEEEEERKKVELIKEQKLRWRTQLENQIEEFRKREEEEKEMFKKEILLEKERLRLQKISQKREKFVEERKRKNLELFWARQCQLKLKQKSSCIQEELLNEEAILEDIFRATNEQKALHDQRVESLKYEKEELVSSIEDSQKEIKKKEKEIKNKNEGTRKLPLETSCRSSRDIRRQELLMDRSIDDRHKEIARLEEEMRKLWMESYNPPLGFVVRHGNILLKRNMEGKKLNGDKPKNITCNTLVIGSQNILYFYNLI
ncbi:Trichoplein keratin filament-binding protein [Armadillidium nasatum]|uniref:Trichoplein keratin filament-binding protein n=1 Tax=Armadillidium nasatum TaxID=96803 RepID=A0A5N5TKY6_9CRUS|nr:Trichoplein keratin filament-binding protein [Armadillidium nasatum]